MTDNVEQRIGYIGSRLREKSTYGGLAVLVGVFLPLLMKQFPELAGANADVIATAISSIGIGLGTLICIFLPEKGASTTAKILIAALALSLFYPAASRAGDIAQPASKAISYTPCQAAAAATATAPATPLSCTGAYVGAGIGGEGSNANIIGNGINGSVFAGGITPTFDAGYQYVSGNWLAGAELDVGYAVGTGATVNGVGNGFNGLRLSEVFKVGGNLNGLLGNQAPITIPPQLANSVLAPYVHIGTTQWQLQGAWANGISSGAGVLFDISPRMFGDLRYTYTNFSAARSGGLTINDDNSILVTINYKLN